MTPRDAQEPSSGPASYHCPQRAHMARRPGDLPVRTFKSGEMIFRQGDPAAGEAYLVHEGTVEVNRRIGGTERFVRTLGTGDLLGEVALFRHGSHSATAVAVDQVVLLVIPAARLEQIVRANPELAIALIRQLARMAAREDGPDGGG
jgi:CRP/FNR family cyclic AMP-dependent transcriptional regulator